MLHCYGMAVEGFEAFKKDHFWPLYIRLDVMMPKKDGFCFTKMSVAKILRNTHRIPTAKTLKQDILPKDLTQTGAGWLHL